MLLLLFLFYPNIISLSVNESNKIFFNNIFSTLFPFLILSHFIISYDVLSVFKLNKKYTIFFLSMITGLPSNAKYIKDLLDSGEIDIISANKQAEDSNLLYKALISLREEKGLKFSDTNLEKKYNSYINSVEK